MQDNEVREAIARIDVRTEVMERKIKSMECTLHGAGDSVGLKTEVEVLRRDSARLEKGVLAAVAAGISAVGSIAAKVIYDMLSAK